MKIFEIMIVIIIAVGILLFYLYFLLGIRKIEKEAKELEKKLNEYIERVLGIDTKSLDTNELKLTRKKKVDE